MRQLIQDLIPHAPQMGLYVGPDIPSGKLRNALRDYAESVDPSDALALYDATLIGSGKDGAVFTADRVVFQNTDLEPVHVVRYVDVVGVRRRRKLIGGRRVMIDVNRGRATFEVSMDFSGRPEAADYVARFLKEAMLRGEARHAGPDTDVAKVRAALDALRADGALSEEDMQAMLQALDRPRPAGDTES